MNIQQNLNALLALGAVGARTSDAYQVSKLKEQGKKLEKADIASLSKDLTGEQQLGLAKGQEDVKRQIALVKPTEKNVESFKKSSEWTKEIQDIIEGEEQEALMQQHKEVEKIQAQRAAREERIKLLTPSSEELLKFGGRR